MGTSDGCKDRAKDVDDVCHAVIVPVGDSWAQRLDRNPDQVSPEVTDLLESLNSGVRLAC